MVAYLFFLSFSCRISRRIPGGIKNNKRFMDRFSICQSSLLRKIAIVISTWYCSVKLLNRTINEKISCPEGYKLTVYQEKIRFQRKTVSSKYDSNLWYNLPI